MNILIHNSLIFFRILSSEPGQKEIKYVAGTLTGNICITETYTLEYILKMHPNVKPYNNILDIKKEYKHLKIT